MSNAAEDTSFDFITGLGLRLQQKRKGHRVGVDAVLLAAAAKAFDAKHIVDVGAGVGAVGIALAKRWPAAQVDLVEINADLAQLAQENAQNNGLASRTRVIIADVTQAASRQAALLQNGVADLVVTNPPFLSAESSRVSPDPERASAHALEKEGLTRWLRASLALLAPRGHFVIIHRADALPALYVGLAGKLGALAVRPIHSYADGDAIRVLLTGIKGSKAPARLLPSLILHESDGTPTAAATALHEGHATL